MMKKSMIIFSILSLAVSLMLSSCGNGNSSSSGAVSPEVTTGVDAGVNDTSGVQVVTVVDLANGAINLGGGTVLQVTTTSTGGSYQQISGITVSVTNEDGKNVEVTIDAVTGDIIYAGVSVGPYAVIITTSTAVYTFNTDSSGTIVGGVEVKLNNAGPEITEGTVQNPSTVNSSVVFDLENGALNLGNGATLVVAIKGTDGNYSLIPGITLTVKDKDGNNVTVSIDPLTGDIIYPGTGNGPYTVVITTADGTTYTLTTDADGKLNGTIDIEKPVDTTPSDNLVVLIKADNGHLDVNNEELNVDEYKPVSANTPSALIVATDETGIVQHKVDENGNITIIPGDGSVSGTYTVAITTDDRVYVIIVTVKEEDGVSVADVQASISYPAGAKIIADFNKGLLNTDNGNVMVSELVDNNYVISSGITITAVDKDGNIINVIIDPVTGDLIYIGTGTFTGPYTITITTADGKTYTIITDQNGQVQGSPVVYDKVAAEKAEAERLAAEKAEAERLVAEKAEAERLAAEKAEAERLAAEKAEAERLAAEKAEAERLAAEKAEAERLAAEKAEAERLAAEKAEAERLAAEKAEAERLAAEKAEAERLAAEKAEAERLAAEKAEAERLAAENYRKRLIVDLTNGQIPNFDLQITKASDSGEYSVNSSIISEITVSNLEYTIDEVTGDIVSPDEVIGSHEVIIKTVDGKTVKFSVENGLIGVITATDNMAVLLSAENGLLGINGETVNVKTAVVTVKDELNKDVKYLVDENGSLTIIPGRWSVDGTYTATITTDSRVYIVIVTVNQGNPEVTTAVSYAKGNSMVLDLESGKLDVKSNEVITVSSIVNGAYVKDQSIKSITAKDETGKSINAVIDSVTGDLIVQGTGSGSYTFVLTTNDGRVVTITSDNYGKMTGIVKDNQRVLLMLNDGAALSDESSLTITENGDAGWNFGSGVSIISARAGNSSIALSNANIAVDPLSGDLILRKDTLNGLPTGPYEIKVSIGSSVYVITTDATGKVTVIGDGLNILNLVINSARPDESWIVYEGKDVVKFATKGIFTWSQSSNISNLVITDADNKTLSSRVSPLNGNSIGTSLSFTDPLNVSFNYIDDKQNTITYKISAVNGKVVSYQALITNPGPDFDFSTVTNLKMFVKVVDKKTALPVPQASINFKDNSQAQVWQGFTGDQGLSEFTATVQTASTTAKVLVSRFGYITNDETINNLGHLIAYASNIALTPEAVIVSPVDSDGDGVSDADDEYPNDATGAKKVVGAYTFGFEDQYRYNSSKFNTSTSGGNDADFNDLVVRLSIEQKIDSQNKLRAIKLTAKTLASLSGANSSFGIYVNGVRYIMILNSKIPNYENTVTIPFTNGIDRNAIGPMPFDPFMIPNGFNDGTNGPSEVHLASVNTTYTGVRKGSGYLKTGISTSVYVNGFVWALIVPEDWQWPKEGTCIAIAYPAKFVNWCNTDGKENVDWYNFPSAGNVVPGQ